MTHRIVPLSPSCCVLSKSPVQSGCFRHLNHNQVFVAEPVNASYRSQNRTTAYFTAKFIGSVSKVTAVMYLDQIEVIASYLLDRFLERAFQRTVS